VKNLLKVKAVLRTKISYHK